MFDKMKTNHATNQAVLSHLKNSREMFGGLKDSVFVSVRPPPFTSPLLPVHTSLLFFTPPVSNQVRVSVSTVCCGDPSISLESPAGAASFTVGHTTQTPPLLA